MRILLTIEYFGKNYSGWQRQKNALSVQQILEDRLTEMLRTEIILFGSGRTDAGVHALGQKAHFDYNGTFPVERMAEAANTSLPYDVRIRSAEIVPNDFHARYSAECKTYLYKMYISRVSRPNKDDGFAQIPYSPEKLDFSLMERACRDIAGTHDFRGFSSTGGGTKDAVRTIFDARLERCGEDIFFEISGNGFLYNMVRIIAGTLAYVGLGKLPPDAVKTVLAEKDRKKAGKTFPAKGLYLIDVEYRPRRIILPTPSKTL